MALKKFRKKHGFEALNWWNFELTEAEQKEYKDLLFPNFSKKDLNMQQKVQVFCWERGLLCLEKFYFEDVLKNIS